MEKAAKIWRKNRHWLIGGALGGIGGFLYWALVGCASGSCPITSSPVMSTIWCMLIGGLLFSAIFSGKHSKSSSGKGAGVPIKE